VKCKGCSLDSILRQDWQKHYDECEQITVPCSHTSCTHFTRRGQLKTHFETDCPAVFVDCIRKCGSRHRRRMRASHAQICSEEIVPCPMRDCFKAYKRRELKAHLNDDNAWHWTNLCTVKNWEITDKQILLGTQ
jgi:hypothetical protein